MTELRHRGHGSAQAAVSCPPPGLWLMLLVPREGQLSAGLSDPPPLKVPKPWRLEPRSPCSWSQRFGQNGPAHSATCWSVIARRSGLPAREEGAWLLIIPDCSSQPPHKHLIYSLHPSHTSNFQGRKTGGEEKHKRKEYKNKQSSSQTCIMGQSGGEKARK